jgi:acetyl esterase/lipase
LGLRTFVKSRAGPIPDLVASRKGYNAIKSWVPNPPRGTKVTKHEIGGVKAVRVATPQSLPGRHMLYLHGGAYINGSPSHYRDFIWRIANVTSSSVLCIDYRLAPEHPFPAALDDAVAAYRWLLADGATPQCMAIMGDSAGGGLTFATLLRLRDEGVPLPAAAVTLAMDRLGLDRRVDPHQRRRRDAQRRAGARPCKPLSGAADPRHPTCRRSTAITPAAADPYPRRQRGGAAR